MRTEIEGGESMPKNAAKLSVFAFLIALAGVSLAFAENPEESFFSKSLHHTGEGMRYWYEEQGGFMDVTGIPYDKLDCKNCHVKTCDACHTQKIGETCLFSVNKAYDMDTCLACHSREGLTFRMGKEKGNLDAHIEKGMVCANCHKGEDVHGSGKAHSSMRDIGAVKVACITCHTASMEVAAHEVHEGKLDCSACHVDNTTACMNCHFDTFLETGSRKGTFFPMQDWTLLINYNGKVTAGTAMSLVYKDKKFILYTPYFTHAVNAKAKGCGECHANPAMKLIEEGKSVPMMAFEDGKVVNWKGVAPVAPEKLEWVYLNKVGDTWAPIESDEAEKIQFVGYGTPLTEEQLESLATPYEE
jgi:hypothetical protein